MSNTITVEVIDIPSAYSGLYPEGDFVYRVSLELENILVGEEVNLDYPNGQQVFDDLEPETEYEIVVIASSPTNSRLNDSIPARFSITTGELPKLAAPVLTIDDIDVNDVTVSWTDVESATTYTISVLDTNGNQAGEELVLSMAGRSQMLTGLDAVTSYTVRVVASAPEYRDSETTQSFTTLEPQLPRVVFVNVSIDETRVALRWESGTSNAQRYIVSVYEGQEISPASLVTTSLVTEMRFSFEGGEPVTAYLFAVVSQAEGFRESMVATTIVETERRTLLPPLVDVESSTNTITLSWQGAESAAQEYVLSLSEAGGMRESGVEVAVSIGSHVFAGLSPDTAYQVEAFSSATSTRYINSESYRSDIRTKQLPQLGESTLRVSNIEGDRATVMWTGIANAMIYNVALKERISQDLVSEIELDGEARDHEFVGLEAVTDYVVELTASARNYRSRVIQEEFSTLEPRLPVPAISTRLIDFETVEASIVNDHNEITYSLILREAGKIIAASELQPGVHTVTLSDLMGRTEYELTVIAKLRGYRNSMIVKTFRTDLEQLPRPQIRVELLDLATAELTWMSLNSIVTYTIELRIAGSTRVLFSSSVAAAAGGVHLNDLIEGVVYEVSVVASASRYHDSVYATEQFEVEVTPLETPQISYSQVGEDTVQLNWDRPLRAEQTTYVISVFEVGVANPVDSQEVSAELLSYTLSRGLEPNKNYRVEVYARDESEIHRNSARAEVSFTTLQVSLEVPTVSIDRVTRNTISLSWVAQEGVAGLMYRAEIEEEGEELQSYEAVAASQASSELSSLQAGTRYTLRIVASAAGRRNNSYEEVFATQLASPEIVVEDADADDGSRMTQSVVLIWTEAVKSASTYELSVRDGDGKEILSMETVEASLLHYDLVGLQEATSYEVKVVAQGEDYPASEITQITFKTLDGDLEIPQVRIVDVELNSATIEWDAVANAQEYTLSIEGSGIDDLSHPAMVFARNATRSSEVTNLQEGTEYRVTLVARAEGYSSSIANRTFSILIQLAMPALSVRVDETTLTVSWGEISNAVAYQINLYLGTDREAQPVISNTVELEEGEVSVDLAGLLPAETYTVEVIAFAAENSSQYEDSEASVLQTATEKLTLPTPTDTEIEVSVADNTITVEVVDLPSAYSDFYPEGILGYRVSLELKSTLVGDEITLLFPEGGEVMQVFENLEPETDYEVIVVASSPTENLFNDSTTARFSITTDEFPELIAPMLTISDIDVNSAMVSWGVIVDATTYTINVVDADSVPVGEEIILEAPSSSQELTGLVADTAHRVSVEASAPRYRSNETTISFTTLEPQLQATLISIADLDATDATIEWLEVENATTYTVSIEGAGITEDSHPPTDFDVFAERSLSIIGLQIMTEYTVHIVASAPRYRSSETTQLFTTLQEQLLVEDVEAMVAEDQVMVSWTADSRASRYVVRVYEQQGETSMFFVMATENDNEYEFEGSPVTRYTITVMAQGAGYRASELAQVEVMTERVVLSAVPSTAVTVSATGDSIRVDWSASEDGRNTSYVLSISPAPEDEEEVVVDASQAGSYTFTSLQEDTSYEVMVRSSGDSTLYLSDEERSVYKKSIGTGTKLPTPRITDITEDVTTAQVTWDLESVGDASSYVLSVSGIEGTTTVSASLGMYELTDLEAGTEYMLSVVAIGGESFTASDEASMTFMTLQALLDMPVVSIDEVTANTIRMSWTAQAVEGLMYQAEIEEEGAAEMLSYGAVAASQESSELSGLEAGTSYTLRVMASAAGYRSNDFEISFATQLASPGVSVLVEETTLTFSWTEVANAATYEVNLYLGEGIEAEPVVSGVDVNIKRGMVSIELGGLLPVETYTVEVVAMAVEGSEHAASEAVILSVETEKLTLPAQRM